jgi:hypothetical protein
VNFHTERLRRQPPEPVALAIADVLRVLENLSPAEAGEVLGHVLAGVPDTARDQAVRTLQDIAELALAQALKSNER